MGSVKSAEIIHKVSKARGCGLEMYVESRVSRLKGYAKKWQAITAYHS